MGKQERRKKDNTYELISGHRRKLALEKIGCLEADCIVKELDDDNAIIAMVDSNMYREKILPSEKAFAYKMKLDAIKHQGKRTACTQNVFKSSELIGKENNESREKVRKYIRLTYLIPEILKIVDESYNSKDHHKLTIGITPDVELSYLSIEKQKLVYSVIVYEDRTPSHGQTRLIRKLSSENKLNFDSIEQILMEDKGNQREQISFNKNKIFDVLPFELVKSDKRYIEAYIINAIRSYSKSVSSIE